MTPALALAHRTVWIRAQGVDAFHPKDNFLAFYQDSAAFLNRCASSSQHPDCYLFSDPDSSHSADPEKVQALHLPKTPLATKEAVLGTFRTELLKGSSGDQVILNLNSHGSPSKTANSCLWMSDGQPICETDLTEILQLKPPGVTVYIDAEGCFSGAFVDLAQQDICVSVSSDRRSAGFSGEGFLWTKLQKRSAQNLADIDIPSGSKQIESLLCRKARARVYWQLWPALGSFMDETEPDWTIPTLNSDLLAKDFLLQGDSDDFVRTESYVRGYLEFLKQASAIKCEDVGFSGDLCKSLHSFLSQDFFHEIEKLNETANQLTRSSKKEKRQLVAQFNERLSELLNGKYAQAWKQVSPCLTNIENSFFPEEQAYFHSHRGSIPLFPRTFSQADWEKARRCEAGIRF